MNYYYDNTYYDLVQTYRTMMEWCSKGIDYISFLRMTAEMTEGQKQSLDHWQYAFQQLETKSKSIAGTGNSTYYYYPAAINQLLQEGRLLQDGFTLFIQAPPFTKQVAI